jgi:hypothetical protein
MPAEMPEQGGESSETDHKASVVRTAVAGDAGSYWRRFLPVATAGLVGVAAIVPEQIRIADHLLPAFSHAAGSALPPRELLIASAVLQPALLVLLFAALGAALAHRYGLVSLLAHGWNGRGWGRFRAGLLPALLAGPLLAGLILVADHWLFRSLEPDFFANARAMAGAPAAALAVGALYGGLSEEVMTRWGLLPVFCWLACRFAGRKDECSLIAVWYAIGLSALAFAAAHLPAVSVAAPLSDALLARTLVLNTAAGMVFGWLFWRYTLETAMLSHAAVHVTLFAVGFAGMV